ncbi:LLM class F420-dependent oxidoreductase [soil metagenome]
MRFDTVVGDDQLNPEAQATELESLGYGGVHVTELTHDPFIRATLAIRGTTRAEVGTQIAVAFARNPMTVAMSARDLHEVSGGRFSLGLGTQVSAHITRRFSMPWSSPAARMQEFVSAIRAIWQSWDSGERLNFRGTFYQHTLMTPAFAPPPARFGLPPIHLAAVGTLMAAAAGRVADGLLVHPFHTARYLEEVLLPAVGTGLADAQKTRENFVVTAPAFVVTGATDADRAATAEKVRAQIAFYGSTPAYRGVLALHGWGDLADRLHELSVSRDPDTWTAMARLIDDEVLATFAVVDDDPLAVIPALKARYGGHADRIVMPPPAGVAPEAWKGALAGA